MSVEERYKAVQAGERRQGVCRILAAMQWTATGGVGSLREMSRATWTGQPTMWGMWGEYGN